MSECYEKPVDPSILEIINGRMTPKESEKNRFGEVFTPIRLVCEMMNRLPKSVWKDKDNKWLDPACGVGNFPIMIYYKLMNTLKTVIKTPSIRSKHIIEKMLFMNELNPDNVKTCRQIFKIIDPSAKPNLFENDFLKTTEIGGHATFDIIIGNPPYNKSRDSETSDTALYPEFIYKSVNMSAKYLTFIVPSRWFTGGKNLDSFREFMLGRKDIEYIHNIPDSRTIWPTVDIKGGVNYFLINKTHNGPTEFNGEPIELNKYDILVQNPRAYSIIEKVQKYQERLSDLYLATSYYGITTNSEHLTDNAKLVKCYVSQKKGAVKYVNKSHIHADYDFWKIFTPQGSGVGGDGFGNLIVGTPAEIASQTFFTFKVESKTEAESLRLFLKTKFANFMLSLRKTDQHINRETLAWIPLPPLNRKWNDINIMEYYKLTQTEKRMILGSNTRKARPIKTNTRKNGTRKNV